MKILMTGGSGFIGRHLLEVLLQEGHTLHIVVRASSSLTDINPAVTIFEHNGESISLLNYCKDEKFQGIIHLASLFLVEHKSTDIETLINSNILFGTQLLEAATQTDVSWFIDTGTFWQNYQNKEHNPLNLYAATKEALQLIAKSYTHTSSLKYVTLKLNDTFGPHDTRDKIFNLWMKNINEKEPSLLKMSKGAQIIDISYIEDVVSAYITLIEYLNTNTSKVCQNRVFVVSNTQKLSLKALSTLFEKITQRKLHIQWGAREYREKEIFTPYDQGEAVPNWRQQYSLEESIQKWIKLS